ncbi:MAG TPA: BrnA antitoxin family protein [Aquabacterium sp.]|uniref:BrnA antitoxin family protein n=1 Tax=Aquabacterium sp. TaxID=1872578 RepID=UPI002E313B68|nr:BrnA antitoxin family protein [Aquabacterium sp.]HEX5372472.1 BrnA antitoxin family protein [Aquabacterium sp.]
MPRKPNPELLDDDAPEATKEWFAQAQPASQVLGDLFGDKAAKDMLKPKRGRPALDKPKEHVNIRLDADVLGAFKETGAGWQTRINQVLREWLKTHPKAKVSGL